MASIADTAAEVFRNYVTDGVPSSGPNKPSKDEIRALFTAIANAIAASTQGMQSYATSDDLPTDPAPAEGTQARVYADDTDTNNGVWIYKDGAWAFDSDYYEAVASVVQPLVDAGVDLSKAWATSPDEPDPTNAPGDQSAKTYAQQASATADDIHDLLTTYLRMPDGVRSVIFAGKDDSNVEREHGYIGTDSRLYMKLGLVDFPGGRISSFTRLEANSTKVYYTDLNGGLIGYYDPVTGAGPELIAARGVCASLDERLNKTIDPNGNAVRSFNAHSWRQHHWRREALMETPPEAARDVWAFIGDSWTDAPTRGSGPVAAKMFAEEGDGGGGWTGFGFLTAGTTPYAVGQQPVTIAGNIRPTDYPVTFVGTWLTSATLYGGVPSVNTSCAQSATAGNAIYAFAPGSPVLSGVDLHWIGTADGVCEYAWGTYGGSGSKADPANYTWGADTPIDLQGDVDKNSFAAITGFPTAGAALGLRIKVVSGTCQPAGVNWKSAVSGAVVHKLTCSGHSAHQLAAQVTDASYLAGIASLGLTSAYVLHGTNDQPASSPVQFGADLATIAAALLSQAPSMDIGIIMPAENGRANRTAMSDLALSAAQVAATNDYAFLDLQLSFGLASNPSLYLSTGARPLFNAADGLHPEPTTGSKLIASEILCFINDAL